MALILSSLQAHSGGGWYSDPNPNNAYYPNKVMGQFRNRHGAAQFGGYQAELPCHQLRAYWIDDGNAIVSLHKNC
jgi:hypothetical protein